ncbi:MAG: N-glycosylase/DNA lyase [Candidatus Nanoarchaeia archaeon]|nr:N-glycosylase/DNA lyase [Candidatus Nanoarchaeia archaeon]
MLESDIKNKKKEQADILKNRLSEFEQTYQKGDKEIFRELCFCILTANASARGGMKAIEALGNLIFTGSEKEISSALHKAGYRFWRKRANYITETRKAMKEQCNMQLKKEIEKKRENIEELRAFFDENAKGIGMKEASHFLRNIGFREYAILDKHIVNCLHATKVLKTNNKPKNKAEYLEMEHKMKEFSKKLKVPMAELDLILWSSKTGEILK